MSSVLAPAPHADVESWAGTRFGLTLQHHPSSRVAAVLALLAGVPRDAWDRHTGAVADLLSVPETFVQRHPECFRAYAGWLRELACRRPRGPISVWSAGCATGEEAYDLAAVGHRVVGTRLRVFGTDFSGAALDVAERGIYEPTALRGRSADAVEWLIPGSDGRLVVAPEIAALVSFRRGSLTDDGPPEPVDVVFCRNVLIYCSDEGANRVIRTLGRWLRGPGLLFLAPTDPVPTELEHWRCVALDAPRPVRAYRLGRP